MTVRRQRRWTSARRCTPPGCSPHFNRAGVLACRRRARRHDARPAGGGERRAGAARDGVRRARRARWVSVHRPARRTTTVTATGDADAADAADTGTPDDGPPVDLDALPWPAPADWYAACRDSHLIAVDPAAARTVRSGSSDDLLYLDRYWRQEQLVAASSTRAPAGEPPTQWTSTGCAAALDRLFPTPRRPTTSGWPPRPRRRAVADGHRRRPRAPARRPPSQGCWRCSGCCPDQPPRVALAAPTGKAAARLQEAVATEAAGLQATRAARPRSADRVDAAPAAGLASGVAEPVPPRPRQPAAVRRRGRRRDVDGVADTDVAAAGGACGRTPAWCSSATRTSWHR